MTTRLKNGESLGSPQERLTPEEFKRLASEAQRRGEPTAPLIKRLVLQTIDEVQEQLDDESLGAMVN